jgi:DNA-binding CsgD family transcriptional regulator
VEWATPLAQRWLDGLCSDGRFPISLQRWIAYGSDSSHSLHHGAQRLVFSRLGDGRLLVQRHEPVPEPNTLMRALKLTAREAEVLYWVALGKTNPEIAGVLDMSPRTVNKHLEHIFTKLNVETRTAAATVALNRSRLGLSAQAD